LGAAFHAKPAVAAVAAARIDYGDLTAQFRRIIVPESIERGNILLKLGAGGCTAAIVVGSRSNELLNPAVNS